MHTSSMLRFILCGGSAAPGRPSRKFAREVSEVSCTIILEDGQNTKLELIFLLSNRILTPTHSHRAPGFHIKLPLSSRLLFLDAVIEGQHSRMKPTTLEVVSTSGCLGLVESFLEGEDHANQGGADQLRVRVLN